MRIPSDVGSNITCDGKSIPYALAIDFGITSVVEFGPLFHVVLIILFCLLSGNTFCKYEGYLFSEFAAMTYDIKNLLYFLKN